MKKSIVYILAVLALLMALGGCGDNMESGGIQVTLMEVFQLGVSRNWQHFRTCQFMRQ